MRSKYHHRAFILALMFSAAAAVAALAPATAAAQCCDIGISNGTACTFRVTLELLGGDRVIVVSPGSDTWSIPNCCCYRIVITDKCGVEHHFPTIVGTCIDVDLGTGCCLHICKTSDCRWDITPTHCLCP